MTETQPAPAPLRIIAWAAIVMSASDALDAGTWLLWPAPNPLAAMFPQGIGLVGLKMGAFMIELARYWSLFAAARLVVALAALWTGIALLRRRAWARTAMQAFCWLFLAWTAWTAIWSLAAWLFIVPGTAPDLSSAMRVMQIIREIKSVGWTAVYIIAALLSLRYLRGPQARAALAGGN